MSTFEVPPGSPVYLAVMQRAAGDIDGAIDTLRKAVGESLADADVVTTLATMLAESGQFEKAERWFRHGLKLAPGELSLRMGYSTFLCETGRLPEARELLEGVRKEVREMFASAERGEGEAPAGLRSMLAIAELNLARLAFETGDSATARELSGPWLADEDAWGQAHGVLADMLERDGLDAKDLALGGLATGRVSPYMVCYLLEEVVGGEHVDFAMLEGLIARADKCFAFDWTRAAPEIEAVLARGRQLFGQAVMRGEVDAAAYPIIVGLRARAAAGEAGGPALAGDDEDEGDVEAEAEGDVEDEDGTGFEGVVRLAGWNDYEPGFQVRLGRRAGVWCFETPQDDYPEVPDDLAASLVALFAQGVAGFGPKRSPRTVAIDRSWLIEGLGISKVLRFDDFAVDQWPLVSAALTILEVHAVVVASVSRPAPPFVALLALRGEEYLTIEACWSGHGFEYRRQEEGVQGPIDPIEVTDSIDSIDSIDSMESIDSMDPQALAKWLEGSTPELMSLLPDLGEIMPVVVHPLAAWSLLTPAAINRNGMKAPWREQWLSYTTSAVQNSQVMSLVRAGYLDVPGLDLSPAILSK